MHRQPLLKLLQQHMPADATEQRMTQDTLTFVTNNSDAFERTLLSGHITGSAWIVSPDRRQTVLIHHRKLDRWFQPGGHADGDPDVAAVAFREAEEETGLKSLRLVDPAIFDVDIHSIPARGDIPEHLHYDIRFLIEADPDEPFGFSDEIKDIRWVLMDKIELLPDSESILRMVRKING